MARSDMDIGQGLEEYQNLTLSDLAVLGLEVVVERNAAKPGLFILGPIVVEKLELLGGEMKGFRSFYDQTAPSPAAAKRSLADAILDDWLRAPPF